MIVLYVYRRNDTLIIHNSKFGIAVALANIGLIHKEEKNYDSAFIYLKKSLNIRNKLNDNGSKTYMCTKIAEIYLEVSKFDSTEKYLDKALFYDKKQSITFGYQLLVLRMRTCL